MDFFKSKINEVRDILRKDGVVGIDSISHCVAFYILRCLDDEICNKLNISLKYAFDKFNKADDGITPLDHAKLAEKFYLKGNANCFVHVLVNVFKFNAIRQYGIKTSLYLERIYNIFAQVKPKELNIDCDVVGTIYEIHLATGTSGSGMRDLGQYFTHRKVIKFMVELCAPKVINGKVETILDPAMGTGGFLTMATKYLNDTFDKANPGQKIDWSKNQENIIGFDISESVQSLAYINLLLENGNIFKNIKLHDTLHKDFILDSVHQDKVDIILANMPFGLKNIIHAECCQRIVDLKIRGTKAEPLFLQLMMISLKENGRCAVVVPDGVLFNDAKLHTETRMYLIEKLNLKKVISLEGDFFMNTGVKSSILYFVNDGTTVETEFSKIKLIGDRIAEETIKKVKKDALVKAGYSLFLNKFLESRERKLQGIEYKTLGNNAEFLAKSKRAASFASDDGKYPFYTSSMTEKKCSEADYKEPSLIIGTGGNANIKYSSNFSCSADNFIIKSKDASIIDIKYLYHYLHSNLRILENLFQGTTIKHLSKQSLCNLEIPIPPLELQQQIVSILDADHAVIAANKKLIEMYETRKKGIIFANTLNKPNKVLGDICTTSQGTYITPEMKAETGYFPVYGGGDISSYINKFNKENEIVIAKDGVSLNCVRFVTSKFFLNHHGWTLDILQSGNVSKKYLYYILFANQHKIYNLAAGSAQKGINQKNFYSIEIPIPSPEIQAQIVAQCESIDALIATLTKEIETIESSNVLNKMLEAINNSNVEMGASSTVAGSDGAVVDADAVEPIVAPATPVKRAITVTKRKANSAPIIKKSEMVVVEPVITE